MGYVSISDRRTLVSIWSQDRKQSQTIADPLAIFNLSSAIVCDHDRRIAGDRRRLQKCVSIWSQTIAEVSPICGHMETSLYTLYHHNNFKLLQNDPETGRVFSQPPLISFKRDKNVGNFLVRSALKTNEQPGTFKCARSRCKTCLFIVNTSKISGPKRSVKITDRFTCTSANVIYCITCTLCNKLYIGETGRRLGDRFREHLRDVEKNDKDASKPVARHFNLPNHSKKHMAICGLSLHLGTTESRKNLEQKFIFQIGTLNPHGINERFSFN